MKNKKVTFLLLLTLLVFIWTSKMSLCIELGEMQGKFNVVDVKELPRRVVILPFSNYAKQEYAQEKVFQAAEHIFRVNGFNVVPYSYVKVLLRNMNIYPESEVGLKQIISIGKFFKADYVVLGRIDELKTTRKFRFSNFFVNPFGFGHIMYSKADITVQIVNVHSKKLVYEKQASKIKKRQWAAIYQKPFKNEKRAIENTVYAILYDFFKENRY